MRLAKNQNGGDVVGYDKVEIEGYSIKSKIEQNTSSTIRSSNSKSIFSYNITFIPFVLAWRILKLFGRILLRISKFLD